MFNSEFWTEVWLTVKSQKWRSVLTAFGVFWGIFMLVILLGCSVGLRNGFVGNLVSLPGNAIFIFPKLTSLPYAGFSRDREWKLNNLDLMDLQNRFKDVIQEMGALNDAGEQTVAVNASNGSFNVVGATPSYLHSMPLQVIYGRFINDIDMKQTRKTCVLGKTVYEKLYISGINPCGDNIDVGGVSCTIVGVVKKTNNSVYVTIDENQSVFLPLTTEQIAFNKINELDVGIAILKTGISSALYEERICSYIKQKHGIHPDDENAVGAFNLEDFINQYAALFAAINLLTWIVGLGTLIAGLIGISNIMMITVKERTQEIGVRRALGAMPERITFQIMAESFVLTSLAGFTGLIAGIAVVTLLRAGVESGVNENSFFGIPQIPFVVSIAALFIMILGSLFAGWFPVKRALAIKAIDALRE